MADNWAEAIKGGNELTIKEAKDILAKAKADVEAAKNRSEEEEIIDIPDWPAPPEPEAFEGIAGDFVKLWEDHTEADRAALLVQFLVFAGHAIGREAYYAVGGDNHRVNLYALLVGTSSKARKGQSYGCVKTTFDLVAPPLSVPFDGPNDSTVLPSAEALPILHEASGLSSGEGLIFAVRDETWGKNKKNEVVITDPGVYDKRLLLFESEFASTLRRMVREGNSLSETIRDGWDNKPKLGTMTKATPMTATKPFISLIAHVTRADLSLYLNDVSISNGFANRIMFCATKRVRLLEDPGRPSESKLHEFTKRLAQVIAAARKIKQMHRSIKGNVLWKEIYNKLETPRTGRLHNSVMGRATAYVLRLSMLYALLDSTIGAQLISDDPKSQTKVPYRRLETGRIIEERHLKSAYALWMYAERTSKFVFGDSIGDKTAEKIEKLLIAAGDSGLLTSEIRQKVGANERKGVPGALRLLHEADKIRVEKLKVGATKSADAQRWFIR